MILPSIGDSSEKPLDRLVEDGGFTSIFRTIGCVGDSLSSGEFQLMGDDGKWRYHDKFDYSWGQFIARTTGAKVYNFSSGGMTAKWYIPFAEEMGYWDAAKKCQAYIIALGVNDLCNCRQEPGSVADVDIENPDNNPDTFAGHYAEIIARYRRIQKDPFFFLMTMPRSYPHDEVKAGYQKIHHDLLHDFAKIVPRAYLIDFYEYAPEYDDAFKAAYYLNGHMTPCGYALTAKMVMSYIDYIVRHDIHAFDLVGMMDR